MKTHRLFKLAALLLVCCTMLGCGKEDNPSGGGSDSGTGSIYGCVTDFATGEPVKNANVQLRPSGETTLTGYDGHYEFIDVPCGTYSIKVTKDGYSDLIDDYDIVVKNGKQTKRDVQIQKQPSSLHIYDNENQNQEISELNFGADEGVTQKTFNIFNSGSQSLQYVITIQAEWVSIDEDQIIGTIGIGVTFPIIVTIDRAKLADGNNTTTLLITSSADGGKELTVKARKSGAGNGVYELPAAGLMVQTEDRGCVDWASAKLLCENSTVAGYNDWRLPTKEELAALFDNKEQIGGFEEEGYWSSSNYGSYYYYVDFSNGIAQRAFSNNDHYYVRAVRTWDNSAPISLLDNSNNEITELDFGSDANTTQKTFKIKNTGTQSVGFEVIKTANWIVNTNPGSGELNASSTTSIVVTINRDLLSNGDNTASLLVNTPNNGGKELVVKAKKTATNSIIELSTANLMVQTQDLGYVDWYSAKSMCENSILAGYDDWRLPTQAELMILWNNKDYIGGFNTTVGSGKAKYWSSGYNYNGDPVGVYFYDGSHFWDGAMASHSVRAVRTLNGGGGGGSAPSAPTNVSAEVIGSRIKVSWNSVSNATEYTVYWSNNGSSNYNVIGTTSNLYFYDDAPNEYNYYKVKAKNSYGESSLSSYAYCHYSSGGGQTYSYDFEDGWQGWQVIDADGDGYTWKWANSSGGYNGHNGSIATMVSESYSNDLMVALYPDNYLVSPQRYSISNGARISFYVCAQDADYPAEHYGVFISTQSTPDSDDFVKVWEGTLSAKVKSGGKIRGNHTQGTWYLKTIDLSDYAGQSIWIAIRHFNCSDEFMIDVDDVTIVTGN